MTTDIVIPTKDRPLHLARLISQVKAQIPDAFFIVVDGSEHPVKDVHDGVVLHAPDLKLGGVRQLGLMFCKSKISLNLDDDIILPPFWFATLMKDMDSSGAIVCSSRILFGEPNEPTIAKYYRASGEINYGSAAIMIDTQRLRDLGGWNTEIHMGEDSELRLRMPPGSWVISEAEVWHPVSFRRWIRMAFSYSDGAAILIQKGRMSLLVAVKRMLLKLTRPFVYGWRTRSFRVFIYGSIYNLAYLAGLVRAGVRRL